MSKEAANSNLYRAAIAKNDEFYTQLTDIEKELVHYKDHFKNKIVFCNCDDPKESNFFKYFALNFKFLGLRKLISTHYNKGNNSYKLEVTKDINNDGLINLDDAVKIDLNDDGDFRSNECIEILKEVDIIVTNPPFSLFREYLSQLINQNKKFIIIGSENALTYKEVFPLIKENKVWLGNTRPKEFIQPDGTTKKFGNICWYTNLAIAKRHEDIILYKKYNANEYKKFDHYNAINIDKTKEIPMDYGGAMGVPISFIDKHNPEQFEIIDGLNRYSIIDGPTESTRGKYMAQVDGKPCYVRVIIKHKRLQNGNANLIKAKKSKNDEFYTQLSDIERELQHYTAHFKDKVVYCNCDDPRISNFFKYFAINFKDLGIKKLISTHYNKGGSSYKLEVVEDINNDGKIDLDDAVKTDLKGDGDFRSEECIKILKEADIVVTNPPFSLFREYVAQLVDYEKKFIIIGNKNAITYKEIFPLIKENKMWVGVTPMGADMLFDLTPEYAQKIVAEKKSGSSYRMVDGVPKGRAQACWFTNLEHKKRHEKLILWKTYMPEEYPHYDNYDAVNVNKVADIPIDFDGAMGVPITFIDKYSPEQFEIIGQMATTKVDEFNYGYPYIDGKKKYARILIKNKRLQNGN